MRQNHQTVRKNANHNFLKINRRPNPRITNEQPLEIFLNKVRFSLESFNSEDNPQKIAAITKARNNVPPTTPVIRSNNVLPKLISLCPFNNLLNDISYDDTYFEVINVQRHHGVG